MSCGVGRSYNHFIASPPMKDKFSIFSPTPARTDPLESSIAFKKSPNKFAVYQPEPRTRQFPKYAYQSFSSTNLDHIKRLPHQYANLRQTLSFKNADFEGWPTEDQKQKNAKANSILRQTFNSKPTGKVRSEKVLSESFSGHEGQFHHDAYLRETTGTLGYGRPNTNLTESRSMHSLYEPRQEQPTFESKPSEWRSEQGFKGLSQTHSQHSRIIQQIQILKKIANNQELPLKEHKMSRVQRKYSQPYSETSIESSQSVFRKKARQRDDPQECYTPKIPKYSYEDRFKKVGSPTSTDNSDSRSPPNKFVEVVDSKKKNGKIGLEEFQIGKTLGEGKFGVVMAGRHKKSGCYLAIKKIPKAMIKSHFMIDQLSLEIRLQSCLNHKNILSMYGFFDDLNHLYIVLQYMDQGTLYSLLKKNRILTEKQAATIVKQITQAVQYLHDHDIAHRDIKPQNIVISNNVYKLCDFGWATLCNQRRKTYCGTFDYAAPEILQGKQYDMSVDLWCLGVLTFELLTGKAPFYHMSRKETMKRIINVQSEAIVYPENLSQQAMDFIEKLIRKDPNQRLKASEALKHPFLRNAEEL